MWGPKLKTSLNDWLQIVSAFCATSSGPKYLYFQLQKEVGYIEDTSVLIMRNDNLNFLSKYPPAP
jgi:hypothetical protein